METLQPPKAKRDISLDLAKGIAIVLMVFGHSGSPDWINRFLVLARMPVFFFISGLLLSERYIDNTKDGVKKKIKGYYVPFVKYELIFLLLHNLFYALHIYNNSYTLSDTLIKCAKTLTMTTGEQLLGGYWFLISLTWASVGSLLFLSFLKKHNKLTLVNTGGVFV